MAAGDYPYVSVVLAAELAECASVMLSRAGHKNRTTALVAGAPRFKRADVVSGAVTELIVRSHEDTQMTSERGGYALAFLLVREYDANVVFQQARKGGGFDWWITPKDARSLEFATRLEVSAIEKGTAAAVRARGKKKAVQTKQSDDLDIPAYVVVVEYSQPRIRLTVRR
jgi:hypothetical protein